MIYWIETCRLLRRRCLLPLNITFLFSFIFHHTHAVRFFEPRFFEPSFFLSYSCVAATLGHGDRCAPEPYVTRDKIQTSLVPSGLFLTLMVKEWFVFLLFCLPLTYLLLHTAESLRIPRVRKMKCIMVAVAALSDTLFQHRTEAGIWRTLLSLATSTAAFPCVMPSPCLYSPVYFSIHLWMEKPVQLKYI